MPPKMYAARFLRHFSHHSIVIDEVGRSTQPVKWAEARDDQAEDGEEWHVMRPYQLVPGTC